MALEVSIDQSREFKVSDSDAIQRRRVAVVTRRSAETMTHAVDRRLSLNDLLG
jgi:hypothetical protein